MTLQCWLINQETKESKTTSLCLSSNPASALPYLVSTYLCVSDETMTGFSVILAEISITNFLNPDCVSSAYQW